MIKKILTKEFLKEEYWGKKKSTYQIAKEVGCSYTTIYNRLKKLNIKIKTISEALKGKHRSDATKKKISKIRKGKHHSKETKQKISIARIGTHPSQLAVRNRMKALQVKPNQKELKLNKLLQKVLPKEYKFVGDGKVVFDGLCPDFININGQKKIIEMYGDYWHSKKMAGRGDKRRVKTYKNFGYKTLIIWEHELKDTKKVKNKLLEFNNLINKKWGI